MTVLAPPVVVAEMTALCDHRDHEVTVLTDGTRVAATALGQRFTSAISRDGSLLTVVCDVHIAHVDSPCWGQVTVDMADKGSWRAATPTDHATLTTDAQTVDQ